MVRGNAAGSSASDRLRSLERTPTASRHAAGFRSATIDGGQSGPAFCVALPHRSQIRRGSRGATTGSLRGAGSEARWWRKRMTRHRLSCCLWQARRRGPSRSVTMACHRGPSGLGCDVSPASVGGICSGRSGAVLRNRTATSAFRSAAGAASSEVAPQRNGWALHRGP